MRRTDECGGRRRRAAASPGAVQPTAHFHARGFGGWHRQIRCLLRHADRNGAIPAQNPRAVESAAARRRAGVCRFLSGRECRGVSARALHETGDVGHHGGHVPLYFSEKRLGTGGAHRKTDAPRNLMRLAVRHAHRFLRRHLRARLRQPAGLRVRPFLRL